MTTEQDACCPPEHEVDAPLTGEAAEAELSMLAKALAHPARVAILRQLCASDTCLAGDLSDALPLAPSTVSAHLKTLKEAGLVRGTIDGPRRCYCVDRTHLTRLRRLILALDPLAPETL